MGRRVGLCGVAAFIAVGALALVWGGVASAHRGHWPQAHAGVRASYLHLLRRRALRGHALSAAPGRARAAILGGSQIAIGQAPWQAEVYAELEGGGALSCGGSVLDSTHIVTAAHCAFDPESGQRLGAKAFVAVAGTASVTAEEIKNNPNVQAKFIAAVRVHPMFEYASGPGTPDDVAVLTLEKALTLNATVQAIGLAGAGEVLPEGAGVNLTGFGRQAPGAEPNGSLYSLGLTVGFSGKCGGEADAVFVCASSPAGTGCQGDSGSGATVGASPLLVGIMDTVEVLSGESCRAGATNGLTNVAAPEIRDFIEGSESPPRAPRGGSGIVVRAVPKVGHVVTCEPGPWAGSPSFAYAFVDSRNGQVAQTGAATTYTLTAADVGRTIYCQVTATNAGGAGVARTGSLRPVEAVPVTPTPTPAPQPQPIPPAHSTLSVMSPHLVALANGGVAVKLDCVGSAPCVGKLTLQGIRTAKRKHGRRVSSRLVTLGTAGFSLVAGQAASVTIHLNATARALLAAAHGHLSARLTIAGSQGAEVEVVRVVEKVTHHSRKRR